MDGEEEEGWHKYLAPTSCIYYSRLTCTLLFHLILGRILWSMFCIPYLMIWRKSMIVRKLRAKKLSCLLEFLQWWSCRAKSWSQGSKAQFLIVSHELIRTWFQNFSMFFALEHSWMKSALPSSQQEGRGWAEVPTTLCDSMSSTVLGIFQARILEWGAVPFSRGSSQPRDWTPVSHTVGRFFTSWATREAQEYWSG